MKRKIEITYFIIKQKKHLIDLLIVDLSLSLPSFLSFFFSLFLFNTKSLTKRPTNTEKGTHSGT